MKYIFTIAMLMWSLTGFAQTEGKLVDIHTGNPVSNATLKIVDRNEVTTTNYEGHFKLDLRKGDQVEISHISYKPLILDKIEDHAVIFMEPRTFTIAEVIVQGNPRFDPAQNLVKSDYSEKVVQPKNVGELFNDLNGFSLIKRGNYALDPSFRASQYEQLNVQFDGGTKAMQACPNRMDPITTLVNPEEVTRIEIIKGPFSVRYGNTFAGIVNMVTTPGLDNGELVSGSFSSGYETNGNSLVNILNLNSDMGRLDLSATLSHRDYGDYEAGNGDEIPSSFRSLGYNLKAGYEIHERHRIKAAFRQNFGRDVLHAGLMMDTDEDNSSIASLDYEWSARQKHYRGLTAKVYYSFVDHIMNNYDRPSAEGVEAESTVEAATLGGKLEGKWQFGKQWRLFAGVDLYNVARDGSRERLIKMDMMGNPVDPPKRMVDKVWQDSYVNNFGSFTEARYFPSSKDVFNMGIRLDHVNAEINDPSDSFQALYPDYSSSSEDLISATLSYKRIFSPAYSLEVSVGRGTRPANMEERFISHLNIGRDPYEYIGNPYLDAEVNNQFEIGFKGAEVFSEGFYRLNFGGNVFYSNYENYIVGVVDENLNRKFMPKQEPVHPKVFRNLDKAFKTGFELFADFKLAEKWNLVSELAYVYTENEDFGESLPLTPPLVTRLRAEYEGNVFWGGVYYNITSKQSKIAKSFGEQETPGYEVMDLKAGLHLTKNLDLGAGVLNVFDEYYNNHLSFSFSNQENFRRSPIPESGRNFTFFLNYEF